MFKGLVGESIMMVCAFCALDCVWGGGGSIGVWFWFGAPIMHRMSGLSFSWH